jgi:hypothetical protein
MTALPSNTTKVHLDSATDDPSQARAELATGLDATNTIISYLNGLFGSDGIAATAISTLGVPGLTLFNTFSATQTIRRTDGASAILQLYTNKDSGAVSYIYLGGDNAANENTIYGRIHSQVETNTDGLEDGLVHFSAIRAGTVTIQLSMADGVYTPNATGGDKGIDTINASAYYTDGVLNSGGLVPIERITGATTYDFAIGIDSTYRSYVLKGWLQPATDDVELWLRTDADAGGSFDAGASDYKWGLAGSHGSGNLDRGSLADTKIILGGGSAANDAFSNASDNSVMFEIKFAAPSDSALNQLILYESVGIVNSSTKVTSAFGGGYRDSAAIIDAVRLIFESGTVADGDVTLYGVVNA